MISIYHIFVWKLYKHCPFRNWCIRMIGTRLWPSSKSWDAPPPRTNFGVITPQSTFHRNGHSVGDFRRNRFRLLFKSPHLQRSTLQLSSLTLNCWFLQVDRKALFSKLPTDRMSMRDIECVRLLTEIPFRKKNLIEYRRSNLIDISDTHYTATYYFDDTEWIDSARPLFLPVCFVSGQSIQSGQKMSRRSFKWLKSCVIQHR